MSIGVNLSGAEFGSGTRYGYDYIYPSTKDLDYFVSKGVELIRLPFKWERMQTSLGGELNPDELARMTKFLEAAAARGMEVVLDLHNYGRYAGGVIGTEQVPTSAFADFWAKLALALGQHEAIWGFGLMNEPHGMGGADVWPDAAQAAVDAIRAVDMSTRIIVSGDAWSSAHSWQKHNANLLIDDPANNLVYEAHVYFDNDNSGTYDQSYDGEGAYPDRGVDRIRPFLEWLEANGQKGFIGEFGVPGDDPRWLTVLENTMSAMREAGVDGTYWSAGPWWGNYPLSVQPANGVDKPQMAVISEYAGDLYGADVSGSSGNDLFVMDDLPYQIFEAIGGGYDEVRASVSYALGAGQEIEKLTLTGSGDINGTGNEFANTLVGNSGLNVLQGLGGNDTYIVQNTGDRVFEAAGAGFDEVRSSVTFALGAGQEIEKLVLTGSADIDGTGNEFSNSLVGNAGRNVLAGLGGDDTYVIQNENDEVVEALGGGSDQVRSSVSFVLGAGQEIEKLVLTGSADINGTGNDFANVLLGNAGLNILAGLGGDDCYIVQNAGDQVLEAVGGGKDQVRSSVSFVLATGQEIEKLVLTGSANIDGTGNEFSNIFLGNMGRNIFTGLGGDDTYIVQNADDQVIEAAGGGYDLVESSVSFALGSGQEIEKLRLTGTADINATGNGFANILVGNAGINILAGLGGDDTYEISDARDQVIEAIGGGRDLVVSTVSYSLAAGQEIEKLVLTGSGNIDATGNEFGNILVGNAGINILSGLGGDDSYEIYNAADQVMEAAGRGKDLVVSHVSWAMGAGQEIEKLVLAGSADLNATGNEFANILVGNSGVNILAGMGGDDTYEIYNSADQVLEAAGGGKDLVVSYVSWVMSDGQEIEKARLAGSADLDLTGNSFGNNLVGNTGANRLEGGGGRDYMFAGVDEAQDVFVFRDPADSGATAGTADQIYEFRSFEGAAPGTSDILDFSLLDADPADGDQALRFVSEFTTAASGEPLGQIMLQENDGWTDVLVDLDGDSSVDMMVQVHSSGSLTGADFLL